MKIGSENKREKPEKTTVMKATLGRLPEYLRVLTSAEMEEYESVSATTIAKALNLGEVQVRKDLSAVSGKGKPKTGYVKKDLIERLNAVLGRDKLTSAVIVGAGKLGKALSDYGKFVKYGVEIVAAFDVNSALVTDDIHGKRIYHISEFADFVKSNNVEIGVITVPKSAAQSVCDMMVKSGIKAIWNFAPQPIEVPKGVLLQQENLALSLAFLKLQLKNY